MTRAVGADRTIPLQRATPSELVAISQEARRVVGGDQAFGRCCWGCTLKLTTMAPLIRLPRPVIKRQYADKGDTTAVQDEGSWLDY